MDAGVIWGIASGIFAAGGAIGGAKVALNGTRQRVKDLGESLDEHIEMDHHVQLEIIDRLARIETKLDNVK